MLVLKNSFQWGIMSLSILRIKRQRLDKEEAWWRPSQIGKAPLHCIYANWLVPITSNVLHEFFSIHLALSSVGYSLKTAFRRYQIWPESVVWKKRYEGNKRVSYIDPAFLSSLHWFLNEWSVVGGKMVQCVSRLWRLVLAIRLGHNHHKLRILS